MNKPILPILAATFVLLMLVSAVVPVAAVTRLPTPTAKDPVITVVSIPEDDQLRQTGVMWFDPAAVRTWVTYAGAPASTTPPTGGVGELDQRFMMRADPWWGSSSPYIAPINHGYTLTPGPQNLAALDPTGRFAATDTIFWQRKFSQFKLMVTYQDGLPGQSGNVGVPMADLINAGKAFLFCHIYEKDKVEPKIPQSGDMKGYEIIKTSITDVSDFFVCKLRVSGEAGVYVVDLYYIGPQSSEYVADLIVMFKVELMPAATGLKVPAWGMDMQDLCMLAWPFADPFRILGITADQAGIFGDWQKYPHLIPKPEHKWIWSSPDPLDGYSNCAEAVMFQRNLMGATIPIGV